MTMLTGALPAGTEFGDIEVKVGTGASAVTVNWVTFDVPPAAASLTTVTGTVPTVAICAAVT